MNNKQFVLVLAVLYLSLFSVHVLASPRAASQEECLYAADMAISTRAMVLEGLEDKKIIGVLLKMYIVPQAPGWISALLPSARSDKRDTHTYSKNFYDHCLKNNGRMEGFFGLGT